MLTVSPQGHFASLTTMLESILLLRVWVELISVPGVARRVRAKGKDSYMALQTDLGQTRTHKVFLPPSVLSLPSQPTLPVDNLLSKWLNLKTMSTLLQTCPGFPTLCLCFSHTPFIWNVPSTSSQLPTKSYSSSQAWAAKPAIPATLKAGVGRFQVQGLFAQLKMMLFQK